LPLGSYTITPNEFSTGQPNKPTCRVFTPTSGAQQRNVTAGETVTVNVSYTSAPCDA